jgi:hypothetical protein
MKVISLRTWDYLHVAINSSRPILLGSYQKKKKEYSSYDTKQNL